MRWRIGTIGFGYEQWNGLVFPAGTRQKDRLRVYAEQFDSVELDTTFYAVPNAGRMVTWSRQVPDDFRFVLKAPKAASHDAEPGPNGWPTLRTWLRGFADVALRLEEKLGAVLLQLPPGFDRRRVDDLRVMLDSLEGARVFLELRHRSWWNAPITADLRERGVTWANVDRSPKGFAAWPPSDPRDRRADTAWLAPPTSPILSLRLNGIHAQFARDDVLEVDPSARIAWWFDQLEPVIAESTEGYVMCGNSFAGCGPATAALVRARLALPAVPPPQTSLFG